MPYCIQADIENLFGVQNVARWSNLDNTTTGANAARITAAIAYAQAYLDDRFRHSRYAVPLTPIGGPLIAVTDLAARLAGCWLYEARGGDDADGNPQGNPLAGHRRYVERAIGRYLSGQDQLAAVQVPLVTTVPHVTG